MLLHVHFYFNGLLCVHSLVSLFHPQVTGLAQIHNELCSVMQDTLYPQRKTRGYTHPLHTGGKAPLPQQELHCPAQKGSLGQTPAHFCLCSVTRAFRSYANIYNRLL